MEPKKEADGPRSTGGEETYRMIGQIYINNFADMMRGHSASVIVLLRITIEWFFIGCTVRWLQKIDYSLYMTNL